MGSRKWRIHLQLACSALHTPMHPPPSHRMHTSIHPHTLPDWPRLCSREVAARMRPHAKPEMARLLPLHIPMHTPMRTDCTPRSTSNAHARSTPFRTGPGAVLGLYSLAVGKRMRPEPEMVRSTPLYLHSHSSPPTHRMHNAHQHPLPDWPRRGAAALLAGCGEATACGDRKGALTFVSFPPPQHPYSHPTRSPIHRCAWVWRA